MANLGHHTRQKFCKGHSQVEEEDACVAATTGVVRGHHMDLCYWGPRVPCPGAQGA